MLTSETQYRGADSHTLSSNQGEKDYVEHFCVLLLDIVYKNKTHQTSNFKVLF